MSDNTATFAPSSRERAKFARLEKYSVGYRSAVRKHLLNDDMTLALYIMAGFVASMAGLFFGMINLWWIAAVPFPLMAATFSVMELINRLPYRNNLRRKHLISKVAKDFIRASKKEFGILPGTKDDSYRSFNANYRPFNAEEVAMDALRGNTNNYYSSSSLILDTHAKVKTTFFYDGEENTFAVEVDNHRMKPLRQPKQVVIASKPQAALTSGPGKQKELEQLKGKKAETVKLPKLNVKDIDFNSFQPAFRKSFFQTTQAYDEVRTYELDVEETYTVERAVKDLQDAITLYEAVAKFRPVEAETMATTIVDELFIELSAITAKHQELLVATLQQKQTYVKSRKQVEADPQLTL